jgi:molybdopterin-guanine dinucleotide biosynthesis protein A
VIAACVLAGGLSTRMGAPDKGLALIGGRPMIARVIDALRPDAAAVVIVANGDPTRFGDLGVPVVPDRDGTAGNGPLAGILAAMDWAAATIPGVRFLATAPSDTPFLPTGIVEALADLAGDDDVVVVARSQSGRHPVVALWPIALAGAVRGALTSGERRLGAVIAGQRNRTLDIPPMPIGEETMDLLLNVNTPEDLVAAQRLAGRLDAM